MATRTPKTRAELTATAVALAAQYQLVKHNSQLFVPVSWTEPVVDDSIKDPVETVWLPMTTDDIMEFGNVHGSTLFQSSSEFNSFIFMLLQEAAVPENKHVEQVLIKTAEGLRALLPDGKLHEPSGDFVPNMLEVELSADEELKAEVFGVISEWVGAEEAAHSLLYHLATTLAPGWSAGKMVILLGGGRNGKSTLMKMIAALLNHRNVSNVTRQQMANREPAVSDLNNKLANIVFDASPIYLADSSSEKTLIVGEPLGVRMLYTNSNLVVRTNGLFIEGLQEEPKSRDKSFALQRRLVRFFFPNTYEEDLEFEKRMLSEPVLGAFLGLLLDHYVTTSERREKLKPTQISYDLQIGQLETNSKTYQYLRYLAQADPTVARKTIGMDADDLASQFHAWLLAEKDNYSAIEAYKMLKDCFVLKRKSVRDGNAIRKKWVIDSFTPEAQRMLEIMEDGGDTDEDEEVPDVVGD